MLMGRPLWTALKHIHPIASLRAPVPSSQPPPECASAAECGKPRDPLQVTPSGNGIAALGWSGQVQQVYSPQYANLQEYTVVALKRDDRNHGAFIYSNHNHLQFQQPTTRNFKQHETAMGEHVMVENNEGITNPFRGFAELKCSNQQAEQETPHGHRLPHRTKQ
ncbi:hypothetical protein PR048_009024 [Dryococelus australis]|uniref:Uncharacterized protein n=1 Tax=Dryococelus australis TaxID=614101 RepID=A0ABQ9HZT6_9NEOP|nr:hypothetical protein PR048_009024 [Dryococelus australis]